MTGCTRHEHKENLHLNSNSSIWVTTQEIKSQKLLEFLEHIIFSEGIRSTEKGVKYIQDAPLCVNKQELVTYKAKFIHMFSFITAEKMWKSEQQNTFDKAP